MSRPTSTRERATIAAGAALLSLAIAGLAVGPTAGAADTMSPPPASPAPMASGGMAMPSPMEGISVEGAWARATMDTTTPGAAYLTMTNRTAVDDALVAVTTPAAGSVEMHETTAGDSGMMGMQQVDRIPLPAGASVTLQPGVEHLMLIDLVGPLTEGSSMPLTLTFEHAAPVTVMAQVVSATGMPMPSMAMPMPTMGMPPMSPGASTAPAPSM